MRCIGLGGMDEVGASSYLYELAGVRILIDAGMRPSMIGSDALPNLQLLKEYPPDLILLTHAHLDHVAALPLVMRRFPKTPLFATRTTQALALNVLEDAVKVGKSQGASLYNLGDVARTLNSMRTMSVMEPFEFKGITITPHNAGHIPGAVGLLLECSEGKVFHAGDFSNITTMITDEAYRPEIPLEVDAVITESTYGDTVLPGRKKQVQAFVKGVGKTLAEGGRILIPTFALGRAQELILILLNHQASGLLPKVPIYLDGLVRTITDTMTELIDELPEKLRNRASNSQASPFYADHVIKVPNRQKRERIIATPHPSIVLASSGMLSGGTSPLYARQILTEANAALYIVGYQDAESPGRRLLELERGGDVLLPGQEGFEAVPALCHVERYYLSAHADRVGIIAHLSRYPASRAFLMHGEGNARFTLLETLRKDRYALSPKNSEWVDLLCSTEGFRVKIGFEAPTATEELPVHTPTPPKQDGKIKRFRHNVQIHTEDGHATIIFPEGFKAQDFFPDGTYSLSWMQGTITKADLKLKAPHEVAWAIPAQSLPEVTSHKNEVAPEVNGAVHTQEGLQDLFEELTFPVTPKEAAEQWGCARGVAQQRLMKGVEVALLTRIKRGVYAWEGGFEVQRNENVR